MTKVFFRADGSSEIGMGHVVRCLALVDILRNDFDVSFVIQAPDKTVLQEICNYTEKVIELPFTQNFEEESKLFCALLSSDDIVVLDGYEFKTDYQKAIKATGCKLVFIDDLHQWHQVADVVINQANNISIADYSAEVYTKFAIGFDYILLRKEFLHLSKQKQITSIKRVFVSMGAADTTNVTQKVLEALLLIDTIEEIHLMVGAINKNLPVIKNKISQNAHRKIFLHINISAIQLRDLIFHCNIAICPASGVSLECCAVGIGLVSGYTAENQMDSLNTMENQKCLINFGNFNVQSPMELKDKLVGLNFSDLNRLVENQRKIIDGYSSQRIFKIIEALANRNDTL